MANLNDQIIIEDLYDDNIQPSEEDIIEYAKYIGIDPDKESELMWIARQGVKAPLPKGWKAVHDPHQEELYYFNFETGESIWDHPLDKEYKNLVNEERKTLLQKGKNSYRSDTKLPSPSSTMKTTLQASSKSTSTLSDVINNANKSKLRNDFIFANDYGLEFEEEDIKKEDDSWNKKSDSEDSDDFQKPVDFGIDKETSMNLDRLDVKLMVGKESIDSAPTTSRDVLDSPTRNYIKSVLGQSKQDEEVRKSTKLDSLIEESTKSELKSNKEKELKNLKESLQREFDQRRLELLEDKENRIKKLKQEIESELTRQTEYERRKLINEQEEKLNELKSKLENELQREKDALNRKQSDFLNNMQKEFENEKQLRKQKFSMQLSKYIKSGKSFDELDENEEKREIEIYFDHIEKKYSDKLDDRKKELQTRYEKKTRELEEELRRVYEQEAEQKEQLIRQKKEENLRIENFDKQMEKILAEKVKEFKEKETKEMQQLKEEYEIKIKTFKDKYKQLEENEFNYLESEFQKSKERIQLEFKTKVTGLEQKIKNDRAGLEKQEEDLKKRIEVIQIKRKELEFEWSKLNQKESEIELKKEELKKQILSKTESDDKLRYEIERVKLENEDLNNKLLSMQKVLDKYYSIQENNLNKIVEESKTDLNDEDSFRLSEKINKINSRLSQDFEEDDDIENTNDDTDIKSLVKHAKMKLKLKYELESSSRSLGSSIEDLTNLTESKRAMLHNLNKEKDALRLGNEMLDQYRLQLNKRRQSLQNSKSDLKALETQVQNLKQSERFKINLVLDEKNLNLEKESLDLEQLELNLKTARRLIKQKRQLLNQIENYLTGNRGLLSSDTSEETDLDESRMSLMDTEFNDKNLSEFVTIMQKAHLNGDISDESLTHIQGVLKKIPKLNARLDAVFDTIRQTCFPIEQRVELNSEKIEKRWKSYLSNKKYEQVQSDNSTQQVGLVTPTWQANPAYCRLAYESGSRLLDDKWNQYIGFDSMLKNGKVDTSQFMSTSSSSLGITYFPTQVTIPLSTQNRLNQHREWIRQFKASGANIN